MATAMTINTFKLNSITASPSPSADKPRAAIASTTLFIQVNNLTQGEYEEERFYYEFLVKITGIAGKDPIELSGTADYDKPNYYEEDFTISGFECCYITEDLKCSQAVAQRCNLTVRLRHEYTANTAFGQQSHNVILATYNTFIDVYPPSTYESNDFWLDSEKHIPSSGKIISDHITVKNVKKWIAQLRIWKSWKEQYNHYTDYSHLYVGADTDITAEWYNYCALACGINEKVIGLSFPEAADDAAVATYITASHFTTLAEKVICK